MDGRPALCLAEIRDKNLHWIPEVVAPELKQLRSRCVLVAVEFVKQPMQHGSELVVCDVIDRQLEFDHQSVCCGEISSELICCRSSSACTSLSAAESRRVVSVAVPSRADGAG